MTAGMGQTFDLRTERILAIARPLQVGTADTSAGRCLAMSLELANRVHQKTGRYLPLVRWRVKGDPQYCEHWAVLLDEAHVIDLTRMQVDGQRRLVGPTADYPPHYVQRSTYPSSLLLPGFGSSEAKDRPGRLSGRFLWQSARRILGYDLRLAVETKSPAKLINTISTAVSFAAWLLLRNARLVLERRYEHLTQRAKGHTAFVDKHLPLAQNAAVLNHTNKAKAPSRQRHQAH